MIWAAKSENVHLDIFNNEDLDQNEHSCSLIKNVGWSRSAKVSCIYRHRDVQLILAYSWAPAILVAGKGRGGMFLAHLSYAQNKL